MARKRDIKPGFFINEDLGDLNPFARLLFIGLWCWADKAGRLEDRPRRIKAEILPYDNCDGEELIAMLADAGFVVRYEAEGVKCLQIVNWNKHQSPHPKETESELPSPDQRDVPNSPYEPPVTEFPLRASCEQVESNGISGASNLPASVLQRTCNPVPSIPSFVLDDDEESIGARAREDGGGTDGESDRAFVDPESGEDGFGEPDADWALDNGVDTSPEALHAAKKQIAAAFRGVFGHEPSPAALQNYVTWYTLGNPLELICEALRRAAESNARAPNDYAAQCLRRWRSLRIVCMDGVTQADFDHDKIRRRW